MAQGDSSKATAQGPGLEPSGNIANKTTFFDVYTAGEDRQHQQVFALQSSVATSPPCWSGAGVGEVEVIIMDPSGKNNTVKCTIEDKGNNSYRCTYKPTQEGQHIISVTFAGGQISRSPFTVNVGEGWFIISSPPFTQPSSACSGLPVVLYFLTFIDHPSSASSSSSSSSLSVRDLMVSVSPLEPPLAAVIYCF